MDLAVVLFQKAGTETEHAMPNVDQFELPFFQNKDMYDTFLSYFLNLHPSKSVITYARFVDIWSKYTLKLKVCNCTRFTNCTT